MIKVNRRDAASGLLFIAIGAGFAIASLRTLRLGNAFGMGPGFYPVMLGALLCGLGVMIVISAIGRANEAAGPISWRGIVMVTGSILFFAVGLRTLGLLPALFGSVLLASKATSRTRWRDAIAISTGLSAFCIAVFILALQMPISLIGPWLGGN